MKWKLLAVFGVLVVLFAVSLVVELQNRDAGWDMELVKVSGEDLLCERDSDCTLADTKCCYTCEYGTALNLKTSEKIKKDRADKCKSVNCPIGDCYLNSCTKEGKSEPRASCVNNMCVKTSSKIDCSKVCSSMSMSGEEIRALGCDPDKTSLEYIAMACRCGN